MLNQFTDPMFAMQYLQNRKYTLTVVIPCYNEVETIEPVLRRVIAVGLADEIIIVDDGSKDGTHDVLARDS